MPYVWLPSDPDDFVAAYRSGQSIHTLARLHGKSHETIRGVLHQLGVTLRTRVEQHVAGRWLPPDEAEFRELYASGYSLPMLAKFYGLRSDMPIARLLRELGIPTRSNRETQRLRLARMTPEERAALAAPMQAERRGKSHTPEQLARRARTRYRLGNQKTGPAEEVVYAALQARGVEGIRQFPIGRYNIDIFVAPVAVEVQSAPRYPFTNATLKRRIKDLLEGGTSVYYVVHHRRPIVDAVYDDMVAFLELAQGNPSPVGLYRVVWGSGELVAAGGGDAHQFPLVEAPGDCQHWCPVCAHPYRTGEAVV